MIVFLWLYAVLLVLAQRPGLREDQILLGVMFHSSIWSCTVVVVAFTSRDCYLLAILCDAVLLVLDDVNRYLRRRQA